MEEFIKSSFYKGLSKEARTKALEQFPKPASVQIPSADSVLTDFMGSNFPKWYDDQLAKVQSTILASAFPVFNMWADSLDQDITGEEAAVIPADVVLKTIKSTISLVGNAFNYVSIQRRDNLIKNLPKSQANLAKILTQVAKAGVLQQDGSLFGDKGMTEVSKRISLLDSFRKSAATADPKQSGSRFLGKVPATRKSGDSLGRPSWSPAYKRHLQNRPRYFQPNKPSTGNRNYNSRRFSPKRNYASNRSK